jgi:hypothetical protein
MNTLTMAMKAAPEAGKPLPSPFEGLDKLGAKFRRGQVSLLAAASNGGKSAVASHLSVFGRYDDGEGIPTLYFSADTDRITLGSRVAAGVLRKPLPEAEHLLRVGDQDAWGELASATSHIWFDWSSVLTYKHIEEEVEAYGYGLGDWPQLIVVDNLINIITEEGWKGVDEAMHWLQGVATTTNSHVLVLHHVTGSFVSGNVPIPKAGLLDKVDKRPRLIITLHQPSRNILKMCVVKNSSGPSESMGNYACEIAWLPERSWMSG